jgi:hypothetical protein
MSPRRFGRRDLLRAAGLTLFVPPFLREAMAEPETDSDGVRLAILMQANGTHPRTFWPDPATNHSPILDPILNDPALARKTLLIRGVGNRTAGFGNEHDRGFNSLWTGVPPVGTMEDCFGGGPSIDQVLVRALAPKVLFPSLNLGVLAAEVAQKNGHRHSFSYFGPKQQLPTRTDPYRLYRMLFPDARGTSTPEEVARRLVLKRSVLDYAARDLMDLSARLGPNEARKLDAHATALREYEQRLSASLQSGSGLCQRPGAPPGALDVEVEDNVPALLELLLDLVAVALTCNLTRIVTFAIGHSGNQWRYRWLGIDKNSHEEIAHLDTADGSNVPIAEAMTQIGRWVATNVARFVSRLEATPEDDGTALDRSLVIWANENSTGFHSLEDLPIVFLGRAAGRLTKTGVVSAGAQSHHQLNTTVLRTMGVEAAGYGDQPVCGPLLGVS